MAEPVISVRGIGKRYQLGLTLGGYSYKALRDSIADAFKVPLRLLAGKKRNADGQDKRKNFWALKDISFDVEEGQVVGIIGRNGAGKSTLLKIISEITEPSEGEIRIRGRVASLLEVGTGFHPELTGGENIFMNGAILGMTRSEIKQKFDEIVSFAEVEQFIDTPVKRYSSGMYVRLAFAVAAHLEPEILLVDEVLAVGDAAFQKKCLGKMEEVTRQGRTVLFVSHNMGAISRLTSQCILLSGGKLALNDNTPKVVETYLTQSLGHSRLKIDSIDYYRRDRKNVWEARITRVWINNVTDFIPTIPMGNDFTIFVEIEAAKTIQGAIFNLFIKNAQGFRVAHIFSGDKGFYLFLSPGKTVISLRIKELVLTPGQYFADMGVNISAETIAFDVLLDLPLFNVSNQGKVVEWLNRKWGGIHCDNISWQVENRQTIDSELRHD